LGIFLGSRCNQSGSAGGSGFLKASVSLEPIPESARGALTSLTQLTAPTEPGFLAWRDLKQLSLSWRCGSIARWKKTTCSVSSLPLDNHVATSGGFLRGLTEQFYKLFDLLTDMVARHNPLPSPCSPARDLGHRCL